MRIKYSILRNYRNLRPNLKVEWDSGINLILGRNGIGKTNLLESLSILSGWGAFGRTRNIISWDNQFSRAFTAAEVEGEENFTLSADISSKIVLRQNDKLISCTDLRLALPSIIFTNETINLIDGSPASRRLFIDRLCALLFPPFAKTLADFKYVLRSRILLLKQGKSPNRTTELYCKLGGYIMDARRKIISQLVNIIPDANKKFTLNFLPEIQISCEDYLHEELRRNFSRELRALRPQSGPGYDELAINICATGKSAAESLSRGQKRRLVLYIIITAGKLIAARLKREPILLFDDLTAELDSEGKNFVYNELSKTKWQIFMTAPEKPFNTRKKFGGINLGAL